MLRRTRTIARVAGIPIKADASWLVIVVLVTWIFWTRLHDEGQSLWANAGEALVGSGLFFCSLLAHELAHALEARHRRLEVRGITLYLFGGATEITTELRRPRDEFVMTAVGPWTSIVLGAGFALVAYAGNRLGLGAVGAVAGLLGWFNAFLGVFNLLPGAPLDGGRMVEAAVWRATGDRLLAARASAAGGQAIGYLLVMAGVLEAFYVAGGFVSGLWLVLIGWFLVQAARSERAVTELRAWLADRPLGALVTPTASVPDWMPLDQVAEVWFRQRRLDAVLVEADARVLGVLTLDVLRMVPAAQRPGRRAGDVATTLADLPTADAATPAVDALVQLGRAPLVVTENGRPVGLLTLAEVVASFTRERRLAGVGR